nr:putative ribonuclease H-like domain-containing protein [Tanacetum cinerariifolium]
MRPFGCLVTIFNTLDSLGQFDGNVDEGFLVGYSISSKAFRVFNSRTRIVQETLHVNFLENKPNVTGSGPIWLFDIDSLTKTMNYQPVTAGNQTNPSAGFQEKINLEKAGEEGNQQYEPEFDEKKPESEFNVSLSSSALSKKQDDKTKKEAKGKSLVESFTGYRDLSAEFENYSEDSINKVNNAGTLVSTVEKISPNSTNTFSAASPSNAAASPTHGKSSFIDASQLLDDPGMPELEDITYSDDEDDVGAEADSNNFETSITVSPILTTRVHKDHPVTQIIEPKRVHQALKDPSWIEAMQEELLQFKMQKVWVLVDFPYGKRAISTKWVFKNKKDERGIVVRNKARLVAQGHTQEEGINYEEVFALVARIEAIRLCLAYASFMGFMVFQMDVKSAFLYGTIEEEVNVCQPLGFEDADHPDKNYKVVKALYGLHQAPRACLDKYVVEILRKFRLSYTKSASTLIDTEKPLLKDPDGEDVDVHTYRSMIGSLMYLTSSRPDIMFAVVLSGIESLKRMLYVTTILSVGYLTIQQMVLNSPCLTHIKNWLVQIKRSLTTVAVKNVNDVIRLQALVDKKKLVVMEATIRDAIRLDDAEGVECLPNEEIFAELARIGYEKPSTKLTFYKYIFDSLVRNVDSPSKFYMYPRFHQLIIRNQVGDHSTHTTKYTSHALSQKVFANMRRVGKGFSRFETPLIEGMLVEQQVAEEGDTEVHGEEVNAGDTAEGDISAAHREVPTVAEEPSIPSPTPPTLPPQPSHDIHFTSQAQPTPPQSPQVQPQSPQLEFDKIAQALEITKLKRRVKKLERRNKERMIAEMDQDADVVLKDDKEEAKEVTKDNKVDESVDIQGRQAESQAEIYKIDLKHANKVLSMQEDESEPAKVQEVVEVVTTAKILFEVVTAANETITAASETITAVKAQVPAATLTAALARVTAAPRRWKKGVVIRDPEESTTSIIIPAETKSKDKGKRILVEEPKPLKKQQQIKQDEKYARELEAELSKNIDWDKIIDHVKMKAKEDHAVKKYQALKRKPQTEAQARKNMMLYLKNVDGFKMDYFKGMSYDDIRPIFEEKFNSNVALLMKIKEQIEEEESRALKRLNETSAEKAAKRRKLDEEKDLEASRSLVKESFSTTKPKNFSDDFLLMTLGAMFEKPDIHAQVWKNQISVHGPAKFKGWKLLESCGVQIITFTTTQLILLVERKCPLIRFTLDQMLNAVRLKVEVETEVYLEFLKFTRQQHQKVQL